METIRTSDLNPLKNDQVARLLLQVIELLFRKNSVMLGNNKPVQPNPFSRRDEFINCHVVGLVAFNDLMHVRVEFHMVILDSG